ncbi:unnamed protein product, partial [Brassica oleracea]
ENSIVDDFSLWLAVLLIVVCERRSLFLFNFDLGFIWFMVFLDEGLFLVGVTHLKPLVMVLSRFFCR